MQLSDIKKLRVYYDDLVRAEDSLIRKKHIGPQLFTIKGIISYLLYGTSFSEYAAIGFMQRGTEKNAHI